MDVAAEDAGEKRGGDLGEDFFAEVAVDEAGYGFVFGGRGFFEAVAVGDLGGIGGAGSGAEEGGVFERGEIFGDHHAHAVGDGLELAGYFPGRCLCRHPYIGFAGGVVGGDEVLLKA